MVPMLGSTNRSSRETVKWSDNWIFCFDINRTFQIDPKYITKRSDKNRCPTRPLLCCGATAPTASGKREQRHLIRPFNYVEIALRWANRYLFFANRNATPSGGHTARAAVSFWFRSIYIIYSWKCQLFFVKPEVLRHLRSNPGAKGNDSTFFKTL